MNFFYTTIFGRVPCFVRRDPIGLLLLLTVALTASGETAPPGTQARAHVQKTRLSTKNIYGHDAELCNMGKDAMVD